MEHVNSSVGYGIQQSRFLLPESSGRILFAHGSGSRSFSGERCLPYQIVKRTRSQESIRSDPSTLATISRRSSAISDTNHHTSMEVLPVKHTPDPVKIRHMTSSSSLASCHTPMNISKEKNSTVTRPDFRPPSPRTQMSLFRGEYVNRETPGNLAPMDRFLARDDYNLGTEIEPAQLEREWKKLRSLRSSTLRLRSRLKLKRRELREKSLLKYSIDEAFMKYVREKQASLFSRPTPVAESVDVNLEELFKAMQESRDEYGPLEDDYNDLQEHLDDMEFELAKIEGRLYHTAEPPVAEFSKSESQSERSSLDDPTVFLGISSEDELDNYHPLQEKYLSRLGDLDIVRERYFNLLQEQERLAWVQESRVRTGTELPHDDRRFLEEFQGRRADLQSEMAEIEADVEMWKGQCIAEGLEVSDGSDTSEESTKNEETALQNLEQGVEQKVTEIDTIPVVVHESSHKMFPELLPASNEGKAELEQLVAEFDEDNKGDRIKRWMLHKLRTSPLEVELLVRVFLQVLRKLEIEHWEMGVREWEFSVLFYWERDEANKTAASFDPVYTRSTIFQEGGLEIPKIRDHPYTKSVRMLSEPQCAPINYRRTKSAPGAFNLSRVLEGAEFWKTMEW